MHSNKFCILYSGPPLPFCNELCKRISFVPCIALFKIISRTIYHDILANLLQHGLDLPRFLDGDPESLRNPELVKLITEYSLVACHAVEYSC